MLPRCLPPSFCSVQLTVRVQITIKDFQNGCHGYHHGYDSDGDVKNMKKILMHIWMRDRPGELTIEDLQDGCCGIHRGYRYKLALAILNLHGAPMFPTKFWLNLTYHTEQMRFEDFQDGQIGDHLRYRNRTILAILNPYVTLTPPVKFGFNSHFDLEGDVV